MTNELKEILSYFEEYIKIIDMHDSEPMLNWKDLKIVLDYITNLQEIIKQRDKDIETLLKTIKVDNSKIDKAIEYLHHFDSDEICENITGISKILLNILKGEEND